MRVREVSSSLGWAAARTPTLPPATRTNSYALGAREVVLVEPATPYADEQREWLAWARGLEAQGRTLVAIVATHHHPDHVGGAGAFVRELGVPLWAHEATAARIDVPVSRHLQEGDAIDLAGPRDERWEVLFTPGHAPGHVCLFERRSRTLVVGDMVASEGTILIAPGDGDMQRYLVELGRLAALDATLALPAHGDPIDDPSQLFRHYIAHRLAREAKILTAVGAHGPAPLATLVTHAYDDVAPTLWPFAQLSLEAHLEKLEREGKVARAGENFTAV